VLAAILAAVFSTFGPVGQDASSLYVADQGSVVRVDKENLTRTSLTATTSRRIAAIDIDGDRVLYATAAAPRCEPYEVFPGNSAYHGHKCTWIDADATHELRSVPVTGGEGVALVEHSRGITEIAHDGDWTYWIEQATAEAARDGRLLRRRKVDGFVQLMADGLDVSPENQHPFVLQEDAVCVVSGALLLRISKFGGIARAVADVNSQSSIAGGENLVYFVQQTRVYQFDSRTAVVSPIAFPYTGVGLSYPLSILGIAGSRAVVTENVTSYHYESHIWFAADLCAQSVVTMGGVGNDNYNGYFIPPLSEPGIAIDSDRIYMSDSRVSIFYISPDCRRRHTSRR